jgi:hypothetical protein
MAPHPETTAAMHITEANLCIRINSARPGALLRQDVLDRYRAQLR